MEAKFNYSKIQEEQKTQTKKETESVGRKKADKPVQKKEDSTVTVLTRLNMRKSPASNSDIVRVLEEGEVLHTNGKVIPADNESWLEITDVSPSCYVMKRFVK